MATGATVQIDRLHQYLKLAEATLAQPITPAELDAAVLSPAGIEEIAALFESALAARLVIGGTPVTPELGGEATLDAGRLRFVTYPDPVHPVIRRMVELADDPAAMLALLSASPEGRQVLAGAGGLHAMLYQMTTEAPTPARRRAMDEVLRGAVLRYFKTWTASPELQLEAIGRHEWRGRYVGFWHLHPPRIASDGYAPGLEPSAEDLAIAVGDGPAPHAGVPTGRVRRVRPRSGLRVRHRHAVAGSCRASPVRSLGAAFPAAGSLIPGRDAS